MKVMSKTLHPPKNNISAQINNEASFGFKMPF